MSEDVWKGAAGLEAHDGGGAAGVVEKHPSRSPPEPSRLRLNCWIGTRVMVLEVEVVVGVEGMGGGVAVEAASVIFFDYSFIALVV